MQNGVFPWRLLRVRNLKIFLCRYENKDNHLSSFEIMFSGFRMFNNRARYTATPVACGRAVVVFQLLEHLGRSIESKDRKNMKKVKWGPTDQPTNRRTKRGEESRSTRLKSQERGFHYIILLGLNFGNNSSNSSNPSSNDVENDRLQI